MILKQFYLPCLAHASYLIGDEETGAAENLEKLPKDRPLLVYYAGGYRSSIAASLLQRGGFDSVGEIAGGIVDGKPRNYPCKLRRYCHRISDH